MHIKEHLRFSALSSPLALIFLVITISACTSAEARPRHMNIVHLSGTIQQFYRHRPIHTRTGPIYYNEADFRVHAGSTMAISLCSGMKEPEAAEQFPARTIVIFDAGARGRLNRDAVQGWHIMLLEGRARVINLQPDRFVRINTPEVESRIQGRFAGEYVLQRYRASGKSGLANTGGLTRLQVISGRVHLICMGHVLGPEAGGTFEPGDRISATDNALLYDCPETELHESAGADGTGTYTATSAISISSHVAGNTISPVKNRIIALDSGHGGFTGTVNPQYSYAESEPNLRVTRLLAAMLQACGARVIMTKEDNRRRVSLSDRVKTANESGADIFLSIHHNASNDPNWQNRTEVYHRREADSESVRLAELLRCRLDQAMRIEKSGGARSVTLPAGYYVIRNTNMPAVLGEASYLQHPGETARLLHFNRIFDEASAYFLAIRDYFGGCQSFVPRSIHR